MEYECILYSSVIYIIFVYNSTKYHLIKKLHIFCSSIFIVIAFRDYSLGVDTMTYSDLYYFSEEYVKFYKVNIPSLPSEFLFFSMANFIRLKGESDRIFFVITVL